MTINAIVSANDFVGTYPDGKDSWKEYNTAIALRRQGKSLQRIADAIGRNCTTTYRWISGKNKPHCAVGLERAVGESIVPLSKTSPKLKAMSRLFSWTFWTGSVSRTYQTMIVTSEEQAEKLSSYFKTALDLDSIINPPTEERAAHLIPGGGNKIYGRVLECMGFPVKGRKANRDLSIPKSISESEQASFDFLQVLFNTRRVNAERKHEIYLIHNRTLEGAKEFGSKILRLIQRKLPRAGITQKYLTVTRTRNSYVTRLKLLVKIRTNLTEHYPSIYTDEPQVIEYQ